MIIDGREIAKGKYIKLSENLLKLRKNNRPPNLAIVLVGDNEESERYIKHKIQKSKELEIVPNLIRLPKDTTYDKLKENLQLLNYNKFIDGIILQLPLPEEFYIKNVDHFGSRDKLLRSLINIINPLKDIDGVTEPNIAKYVLGLDSGFIPATPLAVMAMIDSVSYDLTGKHVVVIGRSMIVGKPVSCLLTNRNAATTLLHSKVKDMKQFTIDADVVVSAAGKVNLITEDMVKDGSFVIDVGTNINSDKKIVGDVDFENVSKKVKYITPMPGGIGPLTIYYIMENLIKAYSINIGSNYED